jgi:hypothetical protein
VPFKASRMSWSSLEGETSFPNASGDSVFPIAFLVLVCRSNQFVPSRVVSELVPVLSFLLILAKESTDVCILQRKD